ncbi:MAG: Asp-tRNA(Asn)/Glu-tRNA(Gln) amidotransferase subunit GatA [Candidatus Eisenbacteria bacterium]|nr:Asp-tRNA(Asn)/Glu-tRNA(Gln) amidotransferase subunit GatA [Candidatus Eisenbacteria bacterium]
MNEDIHYLPAHSIRELLKSRNIGAEDVVGASARRIGKFDCRVRAYLSAITEQAISAARAIDRGSVSASDGLLSGVPVAVKNNICTKGIETNCASRILEGYIPPYDSTAVQRLKAAGAILIGKTNLDEFGMGSSTENSAFFPTRNPWNLDKVPGGSSGGSAAAVSAGMATVALGSDTGGSVRQPAGFTNLFGLKPTYGAVSRYGLVAFASSLDQIGIFSRDIEDCATVFNLISGYDPMDSTSSTLTRPVSMEEIKKGLDGVKFGIPESFLEEGVNEEVSSCFEKAVSALESLGARAERIELPNLKYSVASYYLVANAEASSNLARYDGIRYGKRAAHYSDISDMYDKTRTEGFGREVKRRIMLGTYALSSGYYDEYYLRAQKVRTLIKADFEAAFKKVNAVLMPTSPTPPFGFGEKLVDPLSMYLSDIFTLAVNLSGIPSISFPSGFSAEGLPVGTQAIGPSFSEELIFRIAYNFSEKCGFHNKRPELEKQFK